MLSQAGSHRQAHGRALRSMISQAYSHGDSLTGRLTGRLICRLTDTLSQAMLTGRFSQTACSHGVGSQGHVTGRLTGRLSRRPLTRRWLWDGPPGMVLTGMFEGAPTEMLSRAGARGDGRGEGPVGG